MKTTNSDIIRERLRHRRNKIIIRWRGIEEMLRDEGEWEMWEGGLLRMLRQTLSLDQAIQRLGGELPASPRAADPAPVTVPMEDREPVAA